MKTKIKHIYIKIKKIHQKLSTPPKYKNPQSPKTYSPFLLRIVKGNHQASEGRGGGKKLLYSAKLALKAATSVSNSSRSYP